MEINSAKEEEPDLTLVSSSDSEEKANEREESAAKDIKPASETPAQLPESTEDKPRVEESKGPSARSASNTVVPLD